MRMIINMPEGWAPGVCSHCYFQCGHTINCPFTIQEAKRASIVDINKVVVTHVHGYGACIKDPKINGKEVTLWATDKERK